MGQQTAHRPSSAFQKFLDHRNNLPIHFFPFRFGYFVYRHKILHQKDIVDIFQGKEAGRQRVLVCFLRCRRVDRSSEAQPGSGIFMGVWIGGGLNLY